VSVKAVWWVGFKQSGGKDLWCGWLGLRLDWKSRGVTDGDVKNDGLACKK